MPRCFGAPVGEIDDFTLPLPIDRGMGIVNEACQSFRKPVVAPRLLAFAVHSLLHDGPPAVVGDNKAVQVKIEAVLHRRAVDLGDQAARLRKSRSVDTDTIADGDEFLRRLP